MAKVNLSEIALPQEFMIVDDVEYMVEALPATYALEFMEKYQEMMDSGKPDLKVMKELICKSVYKDNKLIDSKRFDIVFSRKFGHLNKLYQEVLKYNFSEVFDQPDSEE